MERELDRIHVPVMRDRILELLAPSLSDSSSLSDSTSLSDSNGLSESSAVSGGASHSRSPIYLDATLGLAGHTISVLERFPSSRIIGIDRDPEAISLARQRIGEALGEGQQEPAANEHVRSRWGTSFPEYIEPVSDRAVLVRARYDDMDLALSDLGIASVDAILMDLGLSSLQIDESDRGFSYSTAAPLDMRMNPADEETAEVIVNTYPAREISKILRQFGEEKFSDRIARGIVAAREVNPITSSVQLVSIIESAIPAAARHSGGHPAKRTFQALRIAVNRELESLDAALPTALDALAVGGRLAVLSYHSLEDRRVKQIFRDYSSSSAPRNLPVIPEHMQPKFALVTRGAEKPDATEVETNRRAASARLRVIERIREAS